MALNRRGQRFGLPKHVGGLGRGQGEPAAGDRRLGFPAVPIAGSVVPAEQRANPRKDFGDRFTAILCKETHLVTLFVTPPPLTGLPDRRFLRLEAAAVGAPFVQKVARVMDDLLEMDGRLEFPPHLSHPVPDRVREVS